MENELRAICAGTKAKEEVIRRSIDQYREVFVRARSAVNKLHEVRSLNGP